MSLKYKEAFCSLLSPKRFPAAQLLYLDPFCQPEEAGAFKTHLHLEQKSEVQKEI